MKQHSEGYPLQLLKCISMLSAAHLATITGNIHVLDDITHIRDTYLNIL